VVISLTNGAADLLKKYKGSRLLVAEALILGNLETFDLQFVEEVVSKLMLETARIRLEATGRLTPEHIEPA